MQPPADLWEAYNSCSEPGEGISLLHFQRFVRLTSFNRWYAYCGALVTIIALAFSTSTQQLIGFQSVPVASEALRPGNIPHSETWAGWFGSPSMGSR